MRRLAATTLLLLAACAADPTTAPPPVTTPPVVTPPPPAPDTLPTLRREFRGVWIATVANIDWPSRGGLPAAQQQSELGALLDRARDAGLNAVVLHVRPASDAVYRSALEPWGAMLAGTQGVDPGWDPLEWAVREAHRRGLELHAWFNPFRAGNTNDSTRLAATHVFRQRRDLVRVYGTQLWQDPGEPAVQDRTMAAVLDVVARYDVDGVHIDDFFYPYLQRDAQNRILDFPDSATYAQLGGTTPRADWRRANVNRFVERFYREVHAAKPMVKVGVSPFGIWRPQNPPGVTGMDAYAEIYADSRTWLQNGWVDYLAPQLYWQIDPPQQSFTALLDWWTAPAQNARGRHVWPGVATYRVRDSGWPLGEVARQVEATRARAARGPSTGVVLYNATTTLAWNGGAVASELARGVFADRAVVPATPWLDAAAPARPEVTVGEGAAPGGGREWTLAPLRPGDADPVRWWLVRWRSGGAWAQQLVFGDERTVTVRPGAAGLDRIAVHAVDAAGNVSEPARWPSAAIAAR
ncbi:family 10 glycosylhydrolase [Roseisolibacter sp. H3M3-2]|uniref:glycoside hydrolase family 10 protein n=1 Tax=Roseisolibacter sp. H3M3-2 TaxID=3031323 RepID=UPI0023DADCBC|nr:family 10 glycosylhydrolase [Roseisolibacter sp. H3M3-2]MDF1503166.1 family 10 glycosylhydrolase [Roseisolibacter sp. H3M3-2]